MREQGIAVALETGLALAFFSILAWVLLQAPAQGAGIGDLVLEQKAHDLLKVWGKTGERDLEAMKGDFRFVFPEGKGKIALDGKETEIGKGRGRGNRRVFEMRMLDADLNEHGWQLEISR